jgi:hypothetical protein
VEDIAQEEILRLNEVILTSLEITSRSILMQDLEGALNPEVNRLDYPRRRSNELRRLETNINIFRS